MPRTIEEEKLIRHHVRLYEGDLERLREVYPDMSPTVAIRRLIRAHLDKRDAQVRTPIPQAEVEV